MEDEAKELTIIETDSLAEVSRELVPIGRIGNLNLFNINQMKRYGWFCMLYGGTHGGKTTTAASAADSVYGRPLLLLDADRSSKVLSHRSDIDVGYVYNWPAVRDAMHEIFVTDHQYQTIVVDNLSEIADMCLRYNTQVINSKDPRQHYAAMTADMLQFVRQCRDYVQISGKTIILTAWEFNQVDEITGKRLIGMAFNPALQQRIGGLLGTVGYLTKVAEDQRVLVFGGLPGSLAKISASDEDRARDIPLKIVNPSLGPILDTMIGGKPYNAK